MYCLHPINVHGWKEILDTENSTPDKPVYKSIPMKAGYHLVPCGKCVACLSRKRNEWTYRLTQEKNYSDYTYFCTLTYDQKSIPVKIKENIPYFVFRKSDIQKYLKRVRYFIDQIDKNIKCSYYCVSEYGSQTHRPHYHMLFYVHGDPFAKHKKQIDMILRNTWEYGFSVFKPADPANIHYVTKYCVKDLETLPDDCVDPVFILASKRPYIGSCHEENLQLQADRSNYEPKVFNNGFPQAMPRIYRNKIGISSYDCMNAEISDFDPRLSKETCEIFARDYVKKFGDRDFSGFATYVNKRLFAIEKSAERRQLKRNEKL